MSFIYNSLASEVTISGEVDTKTNYPDIPTGATIILSKEAVSLAHETNKTTFLTPTAEKTFYTIGLYMVDVSTTTSYEMKLYNADESDYMSFRAFTAKSIFIPLPKMAYTNAQPPKFTGGGAQYIYATLLGYEI